MGAIFYKTFEKLYHDGRYQYSIPENLQRQFDRAFKIFSDELNTNYDGARDLWEKVVWRCLTGRKVDPFSSALKENPWYPHVRIMMQAASTFFPQLPG